MIDLSGNGKTCAALPDFPNGLTQGVSTLLTASGDPLVCGGYPTLYECFSLNSSTNRWEVGPELLYERYYSPSVELPGGRYWVANSNGYNGVGNSEIYQNGEFVPGPPVPVLGLNGRPCAVKISDDEIFFADGESYIMDTNTMEFTMTDDPIIIPSSKSQCGLATKSSGEKMIVVAGGDIAQYQDTVQIYDLSTGIWRIAVEPLIRDSYNGQVVQYMDTFLIVGGRNDQFSQYDTIMQFDPDAETWSLRPERLRCARSSGHFAALVDESKYNCV